MVNTKKLRGRIVEKGLNYEKMAELLNTSSCTFGKKMRNVSSFTVNEAELMIMTLDIPVSEIVDYFFTELAV